MGLKPAPIGLIGITTADLSSSDEPVLAPPSSQRYRYAKVAAAIVVPLGLIFAAHRASTPDGLEAAELAPPVTSGATAPNTGSSGGPVSSRRPPTRVFESGAFGYSNAVRVRVVLPNEPIGLPMQFGGSTEGMRAQWIAFDGKANESEMPWPNSGVVFAPSRPGSYWLAIKRGGIADTIGDLAFLVEHPMPNKMATGINGYHFGRWPKAAEGIVPPGFIEVTTRTSEFPLTPHLSMDDFVVHDGQDAFPKYLHVREPLLDKLELVIAEIAAMRGVSPAMVKLNVASGFRSPAHNGELSGSAQDSRHMYGDAADVAIDVNGDGKLTEIDARLVASAAEIVERKHRDLVGGIGLYFTMEGEGWPYVHIDVRGHRARWRGGAKRGGRVDSLPDGASFDSVALPKPSAPGVPAAQPPALPARDTAATPAAPAPSAGPVAAPAAAPAVTPPAHTTTTAAPVTRPAATPPASSGSTRKPAAQSRRRSAPVPSRVSTAPAPDDPFSAAARKFRDRRP